MNTRISALSTVEHGFEHGFEQSGFGEHYRAAFAKKDKIIPKRNNHWKINKLFTTKTIQKQAVHGYNIFMPKKLLAFNKKIRFGCNKLPPKLH